MPAAPDERKLKHPATAAPTRNIHHAPMPSSRREPSNTFRKDCDDDDAAARTNPRISPGTRREAGERYSRRPSRRLMAPAGVTASVPGGPERDFALPLIPTTQDQPAAPPRQPPTNLRYHSHEDTTVVSPPQTLRGRPNQTRPPPIGTRSTTATWEGTTSTGTSRSRPDAGAGARRTPCPAGPRSGPLSS